MKQLISVRALIRNDNKTLLLRRANGRESILGRYELPGGKLGYGEQPEDALARYIKDDAGLNIQTAQLFDVITYIDHDDRDIQYTFILYLVSLGEGGNKISLSVNYDHYIWKTLADVQQSELTESAKLLLGISSQDIKSAPKGELIDAGNSLSETNPDHVIVYSDGGSRGNPGPSASGFVIMNAGEEVVHQGGMYLGVTTNNQAEYHGVRLGLEKALEMGAKTVDFKMDSLLVVNQLNGIYKIKNRDLWPISERIKDLERQFDKVTFTHVRREFNQLADGMVNKILDAHANGSTNTV
ncbi:MAG TPA: reverse transcriptase-like protein [Candidatus Saccharibacteria bacterium]|nr:reverse transcriptase-like protein [Candidatus Saccharibacteria bacterium]